MLRSLIPSLLLAAPLAADEPIPVLIVSGANNHDWEWTTPALKSILEESGRFEVTITYEPGQDLARPKALAGYAAVLLDYNGPRWGAAAEAAFLDAVEGGLGVSVVHAANNAFPGWVEYETLVCHCWRDGTGHGRFHAFDVEVADRDHPVTRLLPDLVQHPDELYHRLVHMHGAPFRQLASALSSAESGGTGEREPMIVVRSYGAGRVFHTPLGHVWRGDAASRASLEDPQLRNLIVRGTEWAATGDVDDGLGDANALGAEARRAGWRRLFDGETLDGWRSFGKDAPGAGWQVVNGCIRRGGPGGDLISAQAVGDFELEFDFMLAAGTNSGVKYRVVEANGPVGPEFQLIDDARQPRAAKEHWTGSLYDVFAPARDDALRPAGTWNHARIVARGEHLEHWLNGLKTVDVEVGSDAWNAARQASKFRDRADFGAPQRGHILLQDHGGEVWFRNIRLRDFSTLEETPLLGDGLAGWIASGDALWTRDGDTVIGAVGGGAQSFLHTEASYADFLFEVDVKCAVPCNAGIQFRSYVKNGRPFGYQAEIDPSPRAWSGGIFYEGGGWLDDLADDELARAAFRRDGWNRYRIEALGDHLRVWVNAVPTADLVHAKDASGVLAFQVHAGGQGEIHWRAPRLWVFE
jgi:type 1 glutamine amidotransferase